MPLHENPARPHPPLLKGLLGCYLGLTICSVLIHFFLFIHRSIVRPAEYLSRYMDGLLRRTTKQFTEAELERKIGASIDLFKYIEEKDIFRQVSYSHLHG